MTYCFDTGFAVTEGGSNQAAPGFLTPFSIGSNDIVNGIPPSILVAGDGSQRAYTMTPTAFSFEYALEELINVDGVVGIIAVSQESSADGGDSYFFVPDYDHGKVYSFLYE